VLGGEYFEPGFNAFAVRKTADVAGVNERPLRLAHHEQAELEKSVPGKRGEEIGIAATRIQQQAVALFGGEFDKRVLQFEGTQMFEIV
jgi:hypothetical protein